MTKILSTSLCPLQIMLGVNVSPTFRTLRPARLKGAPTGMGGPGRGSASSPGVSYVLIQNSGFLTARILCLRPGLMEDSGGIPRQWCPSSGHCPRNSTYPVPMNTHTHDTLTRAPPRRKQPPPAAQGQKGPGYLHTSYNVALTTPMAALSGFELLWR